MISNQYIMNVTWKQTGRKIEFFFEPSVDDLTSLQKTSSGATYQFGSRSCYFEMPDDWKSSTLHPDLMATAIAFMIDPFVKDTIVLPIGVSQKFHDDYFELRQKKILPVDPQLGSRPLPDDSVPVLCFSGGVDSTAAAILMPKNTWLVFADRDMDDPKQIGHYKKDAALFACQQMQSKGHRVVKVLTNFEFIRDPMGFPTHFSSGVPAILLADHFHSTTIAFGTVLESAFGIGDNKFTQPGGPWLKMLNAAGLPVSLVTGGLSEVATSKLIHDRKDYSDIAQSCMRGKVGAPCSKCMKCFRKSLLQLVFDKVSFHNMELDKMLTFPIIFITMTKSPLHHEDVYVYIYGKNRSFNLGHYLLRKKVRGTKKNKWLIKWFEESQKYIAEKEREQIKESLLRHFDVMTEKDVWQLKNWDPQTFNKSKRYRFWSWLFQKYASYYYERGAPAKRERAKAK